MVRASRRCKRWMGFIIIFLDVAGYRSTNREEERYAAKIILKLYWKSEETVWSVVQSAECRVCSMHNIKFLSFYSVFLTETENRNTVFNQKIQK